MSKHSSDRRTSERHPAQLVVSLQPLNKAGRPDGSPLSAVSLDLSRSGLSLVCDHPLLTDQATVEIQAAGSEKTISLLAHRIRCRRAGSMFEIAVKFVERLKAPIDCAAPPS